MKFLVLMKRFGENKDMVMQDFGRQIRLFEAMSKLGHHIDFLCTDYKKFETKDISRNGMKFYVRPYSPLRHFKFARALNGMIKKNNYDFIVGATEPVLGILGYFHSKKFKIKYIYDLQDDYSSYAAYKLPLVSFFDKIAANNSELVITVSETLNSHIKKFRKRPVLTIHNGIDLSLFKPSDKNKARKILNLPNGNIIAYMGEISKFKGVDILIEAFKIIRRKFPDAYLLLSGRIYDGMNVNQQNIIYRKFLKREEVVIGLNASDVAVVPNPSNNFSKYCFPYKLPEYMACRMKIVATDMGDTSLMLKKYGGSLCRPNDSYDMAAKIIAKLKSRKKADYSEDVKSLTWDNLAGKLDSAIKKLIL